ncbi:histidinol-phosphate transaminase [Massilia arenosa]|uniref:Histidinol-phosphate aminotransferase n=1 Tax=Zemynaea arenosa TaxID=2561931 RepID=A0A4Y9RP14_9BURK|nr:histidinol-phosphate transaminase [Massilia arenosa]TFW10790.1 histidinol-phosphate transaminase [Massilia arenosa]
MSNFDQLIANTIRPDVRALSSYHVADNVGFIRLDQMENPYELSGLLRDELAHRLANAMLNRYPVPSPNELRAKVCAKLGIPAGYDVMLGNGSDELISIVITAVTKPGQRTVVMAPVPSFVMYQRSAQYAGADFVGVPLKEDFSLDRDAMLKAIEEHKPAVVFLAYPNNPTGNLFDKADVNAVIEALGDTGLCVVDEAYEPFAQTSYMGRLPRYPNLIVMRTLSKLGLAGIRLGYMSAAPQLLAEFDKVRPPYNVNILTQTAAAFALDHLEELNAQARAINAERPKLAAALAELPGATVFPAAGNFILFRVPDAERATAKLLANRILAKNLSKMHPLLTNCIRVTVSTPEENAAFLSALQAPDQS